MSKNPRRNNARSNAEKVGAQARAAHNATSSSTSSGARYKSPISMGQATKMAEGIPTTGREFEVLKNTYKRVTMEDFQDSWAASFEHLRRVHKVKKPWVGRSERVTHKVDKWLRQLATNPFNTPLAVIDVGCGDGLLGVEFATRVNAPLLTQIDVQDYRSPDAKGEATIFLRFDDFDPSVLKQPVIVLLSQYLHHRQEPARELKLISDSLPLGSYILVREHDVRESLSELQSNFEHYLYGILEGEKTTWDCATKHSYITFARVRIVLNMLGYQLVGVDKGPSYMASFKRISLESLPGLVEAGNGDGPDKPPNEKDVVNPPPPSNTNVASSTVAVAEGDDAGESSTGGIDLKTAIKQLKVFYSKAVPAPVAAELELLGMLPANVKDGCDHPCAAAYRARAVKSMLSRGVAPGIKAARVLDFFGGGRNQAWTAPLAKHAHLRLTIESAPEDAIQGDVAREFNRQGLASGYDFFIVQDVYQSGDSYKSVLQPQKLLELCNRTTSGKGYIMIRQFIGYAGQDSDLYDEAMWYRSPTEPDMIHFFPGPTGVGYAQHPDMSWIFSTRSTEGLDISDIAQFGPYKIFCVAPAKPNAQPLGAANLTPGHARVERRRLAVTRGQMVFDDVIDALHEYAPSLGLRSADEWVLTDTRILAKTGPLYATKLPTPVNLASVTSSVNVAMGNTPFYQRMLHRMPHIYSNIAVGTTRAVMYGLREEALSGLLADNRNFADTTQQLEQARTGWFDDGGWMAIAGPLAALALVALKMWMGRKNGGASTPYAMSLWESLSGRFQRSPRVAVVTDHVAESVTILAESWVSRAVKPFENKIVAAANGLRQIAVAQARLIDGQIDTAARYAANTPTVMDLAMQASNICIVTPIFEELLRTFAPRFAAIYLGVIEPLMKLLHWGPGPAAVSAMFHWCMTLATVSPNGMASNVSKNFLQRVALHMLWNGATFVNAAIQVTEKRSVTSIRYLHAMGSVMGRDASVVVPVAAGSYWLAKSGHWAKPTLRKEADTFRATLNGEVRTMDELGPLLEDYVHHSYEEQGKTYPLITPTELKNPSKKDRHPLLVRHDRYAFVQPSRSPLNLLLCVAHRQLVEPGTKVSAVLWNRIHAEWKALMYEGFLPQKRYTFAEAVAAMDPLKRARLVNCMNKMNRDGRNAITKASISVKWNEVIARRPDSVGIKPRAIVQEAPELIADATAEIHAVSDAMHELWNPGRAYKIMHKDGQEVEVVFVYASGYTAAQLDEAFNAMLDSGATWYWAAGDDNYTYVRIPHLNMCFAYEGDFSKYDSTQGKEALAADLDDMVTMGFDRTACALDCLGRELPFIVQCKTKHIELKMSFELEPIQASGLPSTTCGNSSRNMKNGYHTIANLGYQTPEESAAQLGFLLKFRQHEDPLDGTFLKGWWVLFDSGEVHWLPLPSMVLKLAKMLRHPRDIFPRRLFGRRLSQVCFRLGFLARAHSLQLSNRRTLDCRNAATRHGQRLRFGAQKESNPRLSPRRCQPRTLPTQVAAQIRHRRRRGQRSRDSAWRFARAACVDAGIQRLRQIAHRLSLTRPSPGARGLPKFSTMQQKIEMNAEGLRERKPISLHSGNVVYGHDGAILFRVDPAKRAASNKNLYKAMKAQKQVHKPNPKKSARTHSAVQQLARKHKTKPRRTVVIGNDFGISDRVGRVQKRTRVLQKKVGRRMRNRRRQKRNNHGKTPSKIEEQWDKDLDVQRGPANVDTNWGPVEDEPAPGESWWGPILDTASSVIPHVLPLLAGLGDYEEDDITNQEMPKANSLMAAGTDGEVGCEVPMMHTTGLLTRFTHREYIGDLYSSTASFTPLDLPVNPGMNETFPWGSRSMINFEQYALQGAVFVFESEASEYTASPGLGYVAMSSAYDVSEPKFISKKEMFQSQFAVARKPSKTFSHWIECDPAVQVLPKKFIRAGNIPAGADVHLYDHCRTTIAVGGMQTPGIIIGELWLTYDVEVMFPRSDESTGKVLQFCEVNNTTASATQVSPFGLSWTFNPRNTFNVAMTDTTITFPNWFPAGDFYFIETWSGSAQVATYANPGETLTNCTSGTPGQIGIGGSTTGPATQGRIRVISTTGVGQAVITANSTSFVGPATPSYRAIIMQIPTIPGSSSIFDYGGKQAEERYANMRAMLDGSHAGASQKRDTTTFTLSECDGHWCITHNASGARVSVDEGNATSLGLVTDGLFDLMCAELIKERRDRG